MIEINCEEKNCCFLKTCMKLHKNFTDCADFSDKTITNDDFKNNFLKTWDGTCGNL